MTSTLHTANRAARLHVTARRDLAMHAVELLRHKEEALQRERTRLEGHARRTEEEWQNRCADATAQLVRARALGATSELAALGDDPPHRATVDIRWQTSMGVSYPGEVRCEPSRPPTVTSTAALVPAGIAYRSALVAGADHAAAAAALRQVDTELTATRRRRRAIELRLVPRLDAELHAIDLRLDERDRDEALRTRLAAHARSAPR